MTRLYLVRHGRAAAGWDSDPDPGLDSSGQAQAFEAAERLGSLGPLAVWSSPLRRCRETSAPLARLWGVDVRIEPAVAEIPSPEGYSIGNRLPWLREAMQGTWTDLGDRYLHYRDGVVEALRAAASDVVVFSHFVAINAAIGAAIGDDRVVIRSLDNCSVTVMEVTQSSGAALHLVAGGHEADTLIR